MKEVEIPDGIRFDDDGKCKHNYEELDIGSRCTCGHVLWSLICTRCKHWKVDTVRNELQHKEGEAHDDSAGIVA